jgi:hypothetical protein
MLWSSTGSPNSGIRRRSGSELRTGCECWCEKKLGGEKNIMSNHGSHGRASSAQGQAVNRQASTPKRLPFTEKKQSPWNGVGGARKPGSGQSVWVPFSSKKILRRLGYPRHDFEEACVFWLSLIETVGSEHPWMACQHWVQWPRDQDG